MARVVIIGGSGHVGTYLVPRLVAGGFEVVNVSRGQRGPYAPHPAWDAVRAVTIDRAAAEAEGRFGAAIRELGPDIVIDMVAFTLPSARSLAEALAGQVQHLIHIGTIWVHGHAVTVPTTEAAPRHPFGDYGIAKAAIEDYLLGQARRAGLPATVIHPGHIVGRGWVPLNPAGNFNPAVYAALARGERVALPNFGLETVHHVHADDVAQLVMAAIHGWGASVGEAFHAVSPAALTLRGFAEAMAAWFGQAPDLAFLPWPEWRAGQSAEDAAATFEHVARSPSCSIAKAARLLGYAPRSSLEAVQDSVDALIAAGTVPARRVR